MMLHQEEKEKLNMNDKLCVTTLRCLALDMIDGDKTVGYTEKDMDVKEKALQFIKSKFPDAFDKDNKLVLMKNIKWMMLKLL